jgi:LPS O-antigen subunit length determinant protein (WzzB/FepE family)
LTSICTATKRDGSPCTLPSSGPEGLCWAHDPKNAERRRRGQSRGGKNKPSREVVGIKSQLQNLVQDVLSGELETGRAAVANQLINTRLRAIELERKIKETDELEARIETLEETQGQKGARKWGA